MNSSPWSAYSQHYSRLVGSGNPAASSLTQGSSLNELTLSASLPRQEHMGGYGTTANAHHLLLSSHPGINPPQTTNRTDGSFNTAGLFGTNYDSSVFCTPFQSSAKNHLSSFSQGSNFYKSVNRENDFSDLRGGFMHCNVASNPMNPDGSAALPTGSGLSSSVLFNSPMASGTWRHSAVMPSSCGPFGILPHEAIMSRNHLVERGTDKIVSQSPKTSRTSLTAASFLEQDLNSGYRSVLPSPSRPPSSFLDTGGGSHPMLTPQTDPYLTSVNESYFSSTSKSNFQAYSTFGANLHNSVSRSSSVSSYFYPQTYTSFGASVDKVESPVSQSASTTSNTNLVPNTGVIVNSMQMQNGQGLRQSVISKSTSNSNIIHPQNSNTYGQNLYYFGNISQEDSPISRSLTNTTQSTSTQGFGNISSSHQSLAVGQISYPPMSTPAPASTPANPPPSVSVGQAYIPGAIASNQERLSTSSVTPYGDIYSSPPTSATTYSASGTHPSTPASPRKAENLQHTPQTCSVDHSNLDVDSSQFVDSVHLSSQEDDDKCIEEIVTTSLQPSIRSCESHQSAKLLEDDLSIVDSELIHAETSVQEHKPLSMLPMLPIHSVNSNQTKTIEMDSVFDSQSMPMNLSVLDTITPSQSDNSYVHTAQCNSLPISDVYDLPESLTPPPPDSRKNKPKGKRGRKKGSLNNRLFTFGATKYKPYTETLVSIMKSKDIKQTRNSSKKKDIQEEVRDIQMESTFTESNVLTAEPSANNSDMTSEHLVNFINFSNPVVSNSNWNFNNQDSDNNEKIPVIIDKNKTDNSSVKNDDDSCLQNSKDGAMDDDLGFLTELQANKDNEKDNSSKSEEKIRTGFLQSFLSFLEEDPAPSNDQDKKIPSKKRIKGRPKQSPSKLSSALTSITELEKMDQKEWLINGDVCMKKKDSDEDGEEHFDEASSLDTSLFGSTLQKEVIVPNPEAPSFSSDEEDNSCQGLSDTVAMAIRRLCEDCEPLGPNDSEEMPLKSNDDDQDDRKDETDQKSIGECSFIKNQLKDNEAELEETNEKTDDRMLSNKVVKPNKSKETQICNDIKKDDDIADSEKEEKEDNEVLNDSNIHFISKKLSKKCKTQLTQKNHINPVKRNKTIEDEDKVCDKHQPEISSLTSISEAKEEEMKQKLSFSKYTIITKQELKNVQKTLATDCEISFKKKEKHSKQRKNKKEKLLKGRFRYSAWRPSSKSKYTPVPISVIEDNKDNVIIEKLSTAIENDINGKDSIDNSATHPLRENFEVFLQTLVSQVLDPSFITEIVKENDKYFLSHLQEIEDVMEERKEVLLKWGSWNSQLRHCAETYPNININSCSEKGKSRCQICHGKLGRHSVHFSGQLYNHDTMEPRHNSVNNHSSTHFPVCSNCLTIVTLFSHVYHHKYHFFHKCCSRVDRAREADDKKESHAILEECLQDTDWITQMFHEMENLWDACDSLR
ncbi:serine-rich adhesin for platelets-like isoform X2 [Centruroides vittatus]|uniref:serine-rich adhesin for platelets-like isoform X2 n=1 Tax=Centruroides vittatus TaxID=120091 RepID=UPI0035109242